jgi:integrase
VQQNRRARREEATFGDLWRDYRENRPRRTPEQKKKGIYSTTLEQQWDRVLKKWENKQLSELTYDIVSRLIRKMRNNGAPIYANRIQRHGQAMFSYAKRSRDWRWKGESPFEFDFVSEKGRARKERLRPKTIGAFMKGLDSCSESMKLLFLSVLYTGRRRREAQAMQWGDLDLESGIWNLPDTKAGEPQEVVIPSALVEMLVERETKVKSGKEDWVFPSPSESGHIEEVKKAWALVRKVSGLHKLQPRDLRRTTASWAQDVNVAMPVMQSQLGHASPITTAKHYTKILEEVQRAAMNATVASMIEAANAKAK